MMKISKKIVALLAATTLAMSGITAMAAKGNTDVNIAVGKSVTSKLYGTGGYGGDNVSKAVDGNKDTIFVSCSPDNTEEIVTVDLGGKYPITEVDVHTWGREGTAGDWDLGTGAVFEVYASNTKNASQSVLCENAVKLDSSLYNGKSGDYHSIFDGISGKYRYIQFRYVTGTNKKGDMRLLEMGIYTTAEAFENEPTPVSVGKPVYTNFNAWYNGWDDLDGRNPQKLTDGNKNTTWYGYYYNKGSEPFVITINLENEYYIEKITADWALSNKAGKIDAIWLANNFDNMYSGVECTYDVENDAWVVDDSELSGAGIDNSFKYVMFEITPTAWSGSGTDEPSFNASELTVYSTKAEAAKTVAKSDMVNIVSGKDISSKAYGHATSGYYIPGDAMDGSLDTHFMSDAKKGTKDWLLIDLGRTYKVHNVNVRHGATNGGDGKTDYVEGVQLSNDPNFRAGHYIELSKAKYSIDDTKPLPTSAYNAHEFTQNCPVGEEGSYRYVRVKKIDNNDYTWLVKEIEIYAEASETKFKDISTGKGATGIAGAGAISGSLDQINDGNRKTVTGTYGGVIVIPFDYPMAVDRIEIDTREDYANDGDRHGYNVWLSNANDTTYGAYKVHGITSPDTEGYADGETIVYKVNSDATYKYLMISDFCYIGEIRAISNDTVTGTKFTHVFDGDTLKASYRSETDVNKKAVQIVARYSDGVLYDVKMSDAKDLNGKYGSISFDYVSDGELIDNESMKGFLWEVDSDGKLTGAPVCEYVIK